MRTKLDVRQSDLSKLEMEQDRFPRCLHLRNVFVPCQKDHFRDRRNGWILIGFKYIAVQEIARPKCRKKICEIRDIFRDTLS